MWLVGAILIDEFDNDLGWICEGIFEKEEDAVKNCREEDCFVAEVEINSMIPENIEDVKCIYWPLLETKEESMRKLKTLKKVDSAIIKEIKADKIAAEYLDYLKKEGIDILQQLENLMKEDNKELQ